MVRLLLLLVIVSVICMPIYAQEEKKACEEKCEAKCEAKCDKEKPECKECKCDPCKCEKACKKQSEKKCELVVVKKCEKTDKEMVGIKLSNKQHAYLVKMFEEKKDKNGIVYIHLSKAQKAAILAALEIKAHSKVPVKKEEITPCKHWVFEKAKAQVILSHVDKPKTEVKVEEKVVAPKVEDEKDDDDEKEEGK